MNRTEKEENADWMRRTPEQEKADWMRTLRSLLLTTGADQSAEDRDRDMHALESVISKLHGVLADCARAQVVIDEDERADFQRAQDRVTAWARRRLA